MVESLTSYTVRLAQAHRVTPGQLFTKIVLPLINELPPESRIGKFNSTFGGYSCYFNSCTTPAEALTDALQKLTLRSDLVFLSMLRWRGAISASLLTKKVLAWCPECYNDWAISGTTLYQPLLWTLKIGTFCTFHNVDLSTECPSCRQTSPPLEGRMRIAYCAKCGHWLGHRSSHYQVTGYPSGTDLPPKFVTRQLLGLLATSDSTIDQEKLATRITGLPRSLGLPSLRSLAQVANMQPYHLFKIKDRL